MNLKTFGFLLRILAFCTLPGAVFGGTVQGPTKLVITDQRAADHSLRALNSARRSTVFKAKTRKVEIEDVALAYAGAVAFGGVGAVEILANTSDAQGNSVVAGAFEGTVTFPGGTTFTSSADYDVFVAKFTPAGQTIWARTARGATGLARGYALEGALAIAVDAGGSVYFGGGFVKSLTFINAVGGAGQQLASTGGTVGIEAFVAKYDASGTLAWAKGGGSGGTPTLGLAGAKSAVETLTIDSMGQLFVGGAASGTSFLGRALSAAVGESEAVVALLDPATGGITWMNEYKGPGNDGVSVLQPDGAGGIFGLGYAEKSISFPTTAGLISLTGFAFTNQSWIARWDGSGKTLWAKRPGQGELYLDGMTAAQGFLAITGVVESAATFGSIRIPAPDLYEAILVRFDSSGNPQWGRSLISSVGSYARDVASDPEGNLYTTGLFQGSTSTGDGLDFPEEEPETNYLLKYDRTGESVWLSSLSSTGGRMGIGYEGDKEIPVYVTSQRMSYNRALRAIQLTSDFMGEAWLDPHTLNAPGANRFALITRIPAGEAIILDVYNAASFRPGAVAASSYATVFGSDLAATVGDPTAKASFTDSAGQSKNVELLYVSPGQVNFLMPAGVATGPGTFWLTASNELATFQTVVAKTAPGLFNVYQTATAGNAIYAILYGTGLRGAVSVTAKMGAEPSVVAYAGAQGGFPGLDQINLIVPAAVVGKGQVNIVLTVDGAATNAVKASF